MKPLQPSLGETPEKSTGPKFEAGVYSRETHVRGRGGEIVKLFVWLPEGILKDDPRIYALQEDWANEVKVVMEKGRVILETSSGRVFDREGIQRACHRLATKVEAIFLIETTLHL